MMKKIVLMFAFSAMVAMSYAQSVDEGRKNIYYRKFKTAKDILQKAVAANPADADANYWLGQAYLNQIPPDLAGARAIYAKAMTTTNQNPLIMIGMGHIELLEGKSADARAHFDAALAQGSKKGDVKLLTAVGRANADGDTKTGDPMYGLEKLNAAAKLDPKSAEIQTLIGVSNLKRGPDYGGAAKSAYDQAFALDPTYGYAKLRSARIFQSQNNPTIFIPLLEESVKADAKYAPGYLALYDYYSRRDVNKAKVYLDQYIANAEKDCETDFFYADYQLQAGQRDAALAKAKEMEATCPGETFPKLNKLYAIIYDRQGDSLQAKSYYEKYIAKEVPAALGADDYIAYAMILSKFPGNEALIDQNIDLALSSDTSTVNKLRYLNELAAKYAVDSNYVAQSRLLEKMAKLRPTQTATEYYNRGQAAILAKNYMLADTISSEYISKYADQPQGYIQRTRAAIANDTDTSKGTALPAINQYITYLKLDTAKNKSRILTNYSYQVYYYTTKMKDYPKAMQVVDSILAVDPNSSYGKGAKQLLEKYINQRNTPQTTPADKPKTTTPAKKPATPAKKPAAMGKGR